MTRGTREKLDPLAVFGLMLLRGSRDAVAASLGMDPVTLRRHAKTNDTLQFALDAGEYEYRRRTFPHGRPSGYQQGCRCVDCTSAHAARMLAWRRHNMSQPSTASPDGPP